ncbi:MAG: FGGY family carbohydrate kinase [Planctomycetes bacterium]|nr:FGGY family carbohydrate kinase [Planctomycetota bacterium]
MLILGVDIGTTSLKLGVFRLSDTARGAGEQEADALQLVRQFSQTYAINVYDHGRCADIGPDKWQAAFVAGCRALAEEIAAVDIVSLSGTTPGLTAMDKDGSALHPAILMLDQRSHRQAREIIDTIGLDRLLETTANMPVAGGCSLASILWLRDNVPQVFRRTHQFGHSNTWFAHWLTGAYALDPSSASLTGLYNTACNDCTWNADIARAFDLSLDRLPPLIPAWQSVGRVRPVLARELGLKKEPPVLIGGNDAVLAAYSVGVDTPGQVINVNGTCEITLVCLPRCLPSQNYNIRAHVLPDRWLTLHVMNAGGKALEWFKGVFCSEMTNTQFYDGFLPRALDAWLDPVAQPPPAGGSTEPPTPGQEIPPADRGPTGPGTPHDPAVTYTPYLMGSRYSLEPLTAELLGLTQTTTREEILAALVRGLCQYQSRHLREVEEHVPLERTIHLTGGAVSGALIRAKQEWMRDADYIHAHDSSVRGAALLARLHVAPGAMG